jgi:hypothetical protein
MWLSFNLIQSALLFLSCCFDSLREYGFINHSDSFTHIELIFTHDSICSFVLIVGIGVSAGEPWLYPSFATS